MTTGYSQSKMDTLLLAKANTSALASVAFTGNYNVLTNKPTIPATAADVGAVSVTTTVNGHALSANVTVTKTDLGLGNVNNTADASKTVLAAASLTSVAGLPPGSVLTIQKDTVTGFWPASYDVNGLPVYTGGSSSAGVRPTGRTDIMCIWKGADPSPGIVSSGTAGMLSNVDERHVQ